MNSLSAQSLMQHITDGDLNAVSALLANGIINLDERDEDGQTFLMIACQRGHAAIVQRLLQEPTVDVNAVDNDNWTALLNAAKHGSVEILSMLLNADADIEHRDMAGWTALMWTCYKGCTEAAKLLLSKDANPNVKGEHHMSCLTWAAGRGHTDVVKELLRHDAKVNTADKYGTTPLIWACRKGHIDIVDMMLQAGAVVDKAGMNSWTALIVAAAGGYADVVHSILERHPNVNAVDKDGYTALTIAAKEGFVEITSMLLQREAYVNLPDRYGDSILIHAVKGNHLEVVRGLIKKYADVDVQGVDGKTALYWAVDKGLPVMTKVLLDASANTEIATKDGDSPLLRAVRNRNLDLVQLLLEKGAKVSTCDKRGDNPLHVAVRGRSKRITDFLLRNPKHARLLYSKNKAGETPYQIDSAHDRSVLGQVFAASNLNADETVQGYEMYSSTIADVLSDPSLHTPITVGLYARWGSGKSFLISKLRKEMEAFAERSIDVLFEFSVLQFFVVLLTSVIIGVSLGVGVYWPIGLAVGGGIFCFQYILLALVWYGSTRREWDIATRLSKYLAHKLQFLSLFLHLIFCNEPEQKQRETSGTRFLFSDNPRIMTLVGDKFIIGMIGSLCDALEAEYGVMVPRLYRIFKPLKACEHGNFKSICCVPYFVIVFLVLICAIAVLIMMGIFGFHSFGETDPVNYTLVNSILITLGSIVGLAVLANIYTWMRAIIHLATPTRKQVERLSRRLDSIKMDGFSTLLKKEVEAIGDLAHCMDAFTNNHTRLVVIVDGLDSCAQDKLLQVLDMVHILFGGSNQDSNSPFITILAVDPHIIIRGIEHNLNSHFRESSINGHDYLRTIVQLPLFIQSQALPRNLALPPPRNYSTTRTDVLLSANERANVETARQESNMSGASYLSLTDIGKSNKNASKRQKLSTSNTASAGATFGSTTLVRQPSHFDLSKSIGKSSYFSDINPRSMRRLMNLLAVTGRLLRAYNIDFNWYKLASWINITEQWPYRLSWIILEVEDNSDIEDTQPLKFVYDRVSPKIPSSKDVDPLVEIDRNVRKLEVFLANSSPPLTVADLRRFLPCTVNVDPYLRKLIRELQQNTDLLTSEYGAYNNSFDQMNGVWPPSQSRPSGAGVQTLGTQRRSQQIQHPIGSPRLPPARAFFPPHPTPYSMMQGMVYPPPNNFGMYPMMPSQMYMHTYDTQQASAPPRATAGTAEAKITEKPLSAMSLDDVINLLGRIDGLNHRLLGDYRQRFVDNNINGTVLLTCDLNELKPVLQMAFGDWVLLRSLVESLRYQEMHVDVDGADDGGMPSHMGVVRLSAPFEQTVDEKSLQLNALSSAQIVASVTSSKKVMSDLMNSIAKLPCAGNEVVSSQCVSSPNLKVQPILKEKLESAEMPIDLPSPPDGRKPLNRQDSFVSEVLMESETLRGFILASVASSDSDMDSPVGEDGDVQRGISPIPEEPTLSRESSVISLGAAANRAAFSRQASQESESTVPGDRVFFVGPDNDSGESDSEEVERLSRKSSLVTRRKGPTRSPQSVVRQDSSKTMVAENEARHSSLAEKQKRSGSKHAQEHGSRKSSLSKALSESPSIGKTKHTKADRYNESTMPLMTAYFPIACDRGPERSIQGSVFISPASISPRVTQDSPSSVTSSFRDDVESYALNVGSCSPPKSCLREESLPCQVGSNQIPVTSSSQTLPVLQTTSRPVSTESVTFFIEDEPSSPGTENVGVAVELDSFSPGDLTYSDGTGKNMSHHVFL